MASCVVVQCPVVSIDRLAVDLLKTCSHTLNFELVAEIMRDTSIIFAFCFV